MTGRKSPCRGFTLIEVLVCLALMALVSVILVTSLRIGGHAWQRVAKNAEAVDDVQRAQAFLRAKLSSLYPGPGVSERETSSALQSDGQFLAFSSIAPAGKAAGIARYRIAVSTSGHSLEITFDSEQYGHGTDRMFLSETLLANVSSMEIQFYVRRDAEPGQWLNHWERPSEIPRLIRIDVHLPESDSRHWPTLYIEPHVDTPVTCQFDAISRRCRVAT
jgi:prepilin-type N-terminal cleavage/methylation domain-containing protein